MVLIFSDTRRAAPNIHADSGDPVASERGFRAGVVGAGHGLVLAEVQGKNGAGDSRRRRASSLGARGR
jgi:hypothetical protein